MRHPEPGLSDVALTRDWPNEFETENATPNLHRYRAGLALGGPIVKNRTFFYAGFEQEHNGSLEDSYISKPLPDAINRILASGAFPCLATKRVTDNFSPASRAETEDSAKMNHQLTAANSLVAAGGQLDHNTPDSPGLPIPFAVTSGIASLPSRDHTVFTSGMVRHTPRHILFAIDHVRTSARRCLFYADALPIPATRYPTNTPNASRFVATRWKN